MNQLRIGDEVFELASDWAELTDAQALKLGHVIGHHTSSNRLDALYTISNDGKALARAFFRAHEAGADPRLIEVLKLTDWLWNPEPVTATSRIAPHVQGIHYHGQRWLLPKPNFADVTMGEYAYADAYMRKHATAKDLESLRSLVFTVFRPARRESEVNSLDWDGYPRERFNAELIDGRVKTYPQVPAIVSYAAVDYVSRGMEWIALRYASAFSKDEKKAYPFGINGLIQSVAEGQVFGNYDQVHGTNIHTVMTWLVKRAYDIAQQEKQAAKITPQKSKR